NRLGLPLLMSIIDTLHRWAGGLIGLLLAVLGLSGGILVHKDTWISLPHAGDAQVQEVGQLAATLTQVMNTPGAQPQSVLFSTESFGLHRLRFSEEAGAYISQTGDTVASWTSKWDRVEL